MTVLIENGVASYKVRCLAEHPPMGFLAFISLLLVNVVERIYAQEDAKMLLNYLTKCCKRLLCHNVNFDIFLFSLLSTHIGIQDLRHPTALLGISFQGQFSTSFKLHFENNLSFSICSCNASDICFLTLCDMISWKNI